MLDIFKRTWLEIDATGRRQLLVLGLAMTAAAVLDVVGVGAIIPFTMLLVQPDVLAGNPVLQRLASLTGISDGRDLMLVLGFGTLAFLVIVNALQVWTTWLLLDFTWQQGRLLSGRLLASYLARPYAWFLGRHTSNLLNTLFNEVQRTVGSVLDPALTIVARGSAALCLIGFLVYLNPFVALAATALLGGAYVAVFALLRRMVSRAGVQAREAREEAHKAASEALGGIKDVKLNGLGAFMLERYNAPSQGMARHEAMVRMMAFAPRYLLEIVALGAFILGALYLGRTGTAQSTGTAVPLLAAYAFASYRLLPSIQQLYSSLTVLRFNIVSLEAILADIHGAPTLVPSSTDAAASFPKGRIEFAQVEFTYPGTEVPVLQGISDVIEPRTSVAFIGQTGSGKTTLIDLLMGLLEPTRGQILVDGIALTPANGAGWQSQIGYVPQNLFLTDDTIAANIAFGIPRAQIDMRRVEKAAQAAHLADFVTTKLEKGYDTIVGERGGRLSNGQKQRIGIARALYRDPKVLILDEATSALDYETEQAVMETVDGLSHALTIIMIAHRLHTISGCDAVFEMQNGRLRRVSADERLARAAGPETKG